MMNTIEVTVAVPGYKSATVTLEKDEPSSDTQLEKTTVIPTPAKPVDHRVYRLNQGINPKGEALVLSGTRHSPAIEHKGELYARDEAYNNVLLGGVLKDAFRTLAISPLDKQLWRASKHAQLEEIINKSAPVTMIANFFGRFATLGEMRDCERQELLIRDSIKLDSDQFNHCQCNLSSDGDGNSHLFLFDQCFPSTPTLAVYVVPGSRAVWMGPFEDFLDSFDYLGLNGYVTVTPSHGDLNLTM